MDLNFEEKSEQERSKTPLRMRYTAEVAVIKRQIGDLEEIRAKLSLSRRKICQLLMVDPSAWTRWEKTGSAPPHIYRALEWYILLTKEAPGQAHSYWISSVQGQIRDQVKAQARDHLNNQLSNIIKSENSESTVNLNREMQIKMEKMALKMNSIKNMAIASLAVGAVGWCAAIYLLF